MDRRNSLRASPEKPPVPEQSTADLINGVSRLQIQSSPSRKDNNNVPPQWESTMSYLGAELDDMNGVRRGHGGTSGGAGGGAGFNVSESTMLFDHHNNPITPLRRSVSGSSMDDMHILLTKDTQISDPFTQNRRSVSAPEKGEALDYDAFYHNLSRLPTTQRYVHFKGILSHYFTILQEHNLDPSTDKFIITIYNQLRSSSSDHHKLSKIIDIFVDSPCNEAMKLSNFLHFKEFQTKSSLFKLWLIKRRKLSELSKSNEIWNMFQKKKFITKWLFKFDVYNEDFKDNAIIFQRVKSQMKFWDIWITNLEERQSFEQVADLQLESKFFKKWQAKPLESNMNADELYNVNLLRKCLQKWKLKTRERSSMNLPKKIFIWNKWREKHQMATSMMTDAEDLELALHAGFFFTKWRKRYEQLSIQDHDLNVIYEASTREKYLKVWTEQLKFKLVENEVLQRRNFFLKQFVMQQFKKRFINDKKAGIFQDSSDLKLVQLTFKKWHMKVQLKEADRNLQYRWLDQWRRRYELNERERQYSQNMMQRNWEKWCVELMKRQNSLELSTAAFQSYTQVIFFKNWKSAIVKSKDDTKKANDHFALKFFKKWKEKKSYVDDMEANATQFHENGSSGLTTKIFFNKWVTRHDDVKESTLMKLVPQFEKTTKETRTRSVLQLWGSIHRELLTLETKFQNEQLKELYVLPIFDRWLQKFDIIEQMQEQADGVNNLNLLSTGFAKFQMAHYRVQELEALLLEHQEDSDLKTLLKYLNLWSLQLMKRRRDNEIVGRFQSRWNRAHMRAILLLWQGKSMESSSRKLLIQQDENGNYEFMNGDDDTIEFPHSLGMSSVKLEDGSAETSGLIIDEDEDDESPTKYKGRNVNGTKSPFLGLQTPQKAIFDPYGSGLTNTRGSSIPGSERIRRRRIDALKVHYSQIKYAIPSPLKSRGPKARGIIDHGRVPSTGSSKKLDFGDLQIFRKNGST